MKARLIVTALLAAVLTFTASPALAAKGPKPPAPDATTTAVATSPYIQYNVNKNVDPLNTWQVNNPTNAQIRADVHITNDETGVTTVHTFYVSAAQYGGKNIMQPTPRNPGETATLYVGTVKLNTATAGEWDSLFQTWQDPALGYINIVTGEWAAKLPS